MKTNYLIVNDTYSRDLEIVTVDELKAQLKEWGDTDTKLVEHDHALYDSEIGDDHLIGIDIADEYWQEQYKELIEKAADNRLAIYSTVSAEVFNAASEEAQCMFSGGSMWLDNIGGKLSDNVTAVRRMVGYQAVVLYSGRKIIGVQITDESMNWYERNYRNSTYSLTDTGVPEKQLRSARAVAEHHFN